MKRIMGIDPGLAEMGYGVIEIINDGRHAIHVEHGVIRTPTGQPMPARLRHLFQELEGLVHLHQPASVAVEELFFSTNVKTAIVVAQARGAAILATARSGAEVHEYSPSEIKKALVGKGRAGKRQVQMMVKAMLGLDAMPSPDHAADALAVALCHFHAESSIITAAERRLRPVPKGQTFSPPEEFNPNKALLAQSRSRRRRR